MKILIPCDWKTIDLLKTNDANDFGEALRKYCFVGNCEETGCYSTFNVIPELKQIKSGIIFDEAKKELYDDIEPTVYHLKIGEKDCCVQYHDPEEDPIRMKFCEPYEIVCGWVWDGDGYLYFRFNNRKVINSDCKCNTWEWIK